MSEKTKGKFETIDKLIIFIICFIFILAVIGTVWWVKYKANKELENIISNYNDIQYSSYKYNIEDNKIHFYKNIKEKSIYECKANCSIENIQMEQFIFNNGDLILIKDNNKYVLYDIIADKNVLELDEYPKYLSVEEYGAINKNNKYGIINKEGKIVNDFEFDEIDSINNYIFAINNNSLIVYNAELKKISQKQLDINNLEDFVLLNNKDKITVIITTKNSSISTTYRFDTATNKFIN